MPKATVSDIMQVLRDIQLLPADQLEEVHQEVPQSADPRTLVQNLVRPDRLTAYQVQQLIEDRGQELSLGPYRLLEPLGEGGMGRVFKAIHTGLGRVVALKVIRQDQKAQDPEVIRRFQREARAAAQMSHPNVVMVYDAGHDGERYYIAMEFVKGVDLAQLVREQGQLPVDQACDYVHQVALGLQHAHERGLVHRDIKPANLLVTLAPAPGEVDSNETLSTIRRASYVVKILDMGLARLTVTEGSSVHGSLTCEGSVMGTPDYIAPEQARNAHRVDIRADLYSLGCTLYFLLTGRPPFPEGTMLEKLLMHQLDEPTPLEELRPGVPPVVVGLVRKLMAKKPDDRFATPAELARELEMLATGATPRMPTRVTPLPQAARPSHSISSLGAKSTAVVAISPTPSPSDSAQAPLSGEVPTKIAVLKGHRGWVMALAFSANRDRLGTAGIDGSVRIWDFSGRKPTEQAVLQANSGAVHSLVFAPNNQELATGSGTLDGLVRLWTVANGGAHPRAVLQRHRAPVDALAYSVDGTRLATGGNDKSIRLWDLTGPEPRERAVLRGHTNIVKAVTFSPDGHMLASGGQDNSVRLWNIGRIWSRERAALLGHTGHVLSVAFSPDARFLASASADQTIRLWNLTGVEPTEHAILDDHPGVVRALLFPPNGRTLLSISDPGHLILWEVATGKLLREWVLPPVMFCSVTFTHDGKYLATGNSDGTVFVFRLARQLEA
jgi:serine/threonine protein kinase